MPQLNRIAVMTGATSGLGAHAVAKMAARCDTRVIVGARGTSQTMPAGVEVLPLELASLDSVRTFADSAIQRLGREQIDMLILNAGMQSAHKDARSADGYELTFATNHLAHHLLARLLLPHLAKGCRVVITTSDLHNPEVIPLAPKTLDAQAWARPTADKPITPMRAYSISKLCNVMTVRSLAAFEDARVRDIRMIAYAPGFTPDTALARNASPVLRAFMFSIVGRSLMRLVGSLDPKFFPNAAERSGEALAQLALGEIAPPAGHLYTSLVKGQLTFPPPSELARDDEACDRLWRESAAMVGLPLAT